MNPFIVLIGLSITVVGLLTPIKKRANNAPTNPSKTVPTEDHATDRLSESENDSINRPGGADNSGHSVGAQEGGETAISEGKPDENGT